MLGSRLLASDRTLLAVEEFPAREPQPPKPEWPRVTGQVPEPHRILRESMVPRYRAQPLPARRARDLTPPPIELRGESVKSAADLERAAARFEALARDSLAAALAPRPSFVKDPFAERSANAHIAAFAVDPARSRPLTRRGLIDRRTDELFQEIRMGGVQRTPQRGESFDSVAGIEKRMFESVDAVVAFGADALDSLERLGGDSPAPDASRVLATAFLASTIRGADLVAIAERVLELHGAGDEEMLAAFVEGLALGPSPDVDGACVGLAQHPAAATLRRAAHRTLARRFGCGPSLALAGAEDSDPSVAFTAVGELFRLRHPEAKNRLEAAFALPGLDAPPQALRRAMVEALALASDPRLIALLESSRHGRPWTAIACAEELAAHVLPAPPSPLERALLHLELAHRAGIRARFSTSDLVVTQEAQLARLLKEARASSTPAGQF